MLFDNFLQFSTVFFRNSVCYI
eukprot:UN18930